MTVLEITELVILAVVVVALSIYYIIKAIKNNWLGKITDCANKAIKEAEKKFTESGSGDKKKAYVLEAVEKECESLGIPFSLLKKLISTLIDKVVANYNVIKK